MELKLLSLNTSPNKGEKKPQEKVEIHENGIIEDYSDSKQKSVCILDNSLIKSFEKLSNCPTLRPGSFGENITVKGLEYVRVGLLDRFETENISLEVTAVGQKFSGKYRYLSDFLIPREGIFCRVKKAGSLSVNETLLYTPKVFTVKVITLSDRASAGEYEDRSGPKIRQMIEEWFDKARKLFSVEVVVIKDDAEQLTQEINKAVNEGTDIIFTTGGTGIGKRDITVDTVKTMLQKEISGVMEMIRVKYGTLKPNALLTRGVAGVIDNTLIYTLPGSVRAVTEYVNEITKTLEHTILMLHGIDAH